MYLIKNRILMFVILLSVDGYPLDYDFSHKIHRRNAWAYSVDVNVKCFSADSYVRLISGENKQIDQIKSGDQLLTIENNQTISTELIMMLDKQSSKTSLFYTIRTKSGHTISLTKYHLIPIKTFNEIENYRFAKDIQLGDYLYVLENNTINVSPVINIKIELKLGYYAPLTMKGTLIINNILSSCFALVYNHYLAQMSMFPFRFYYLSNKLFHFNDPFNIQNAEGLHWTIQILFDFVRYFIPQIFVIQ